LLNLNLNLNSNSGLLTNRSPYNQNGSVYYPNTYAQNYPYTNYNNQYYQSNIYNTPYWNQNSSFNNYYNTQYNTFYLNNIYNNSYNYRYGENPTDLYAINSGLRYTYQQKTDPQGNTYWSREDIQPPVINCFAAPCVTGSAAVSQ